MLVFLFFHVVSVNLYFFFFSSRRRHTRCLSDWSSDVCSSDLAEDAKDLPSATDLPDSGVSPAKVEVAGPGGEVAGPPEQPAAAPAAPPVEPAGGGAGDAASALLENKNLVLDADARKDLRDGVVDPRL